MKKTISILLTAAAIFSCATRKTVIPPAESKPDTIALSEIQKIPAEDVLNQYLSKALLLDKDTNILPFNNDSIEDLSRNMIIGKFIDGQQLYAIDIISPDENATIDFYAYDRQWKKAGPQEKIIDVWMVTFNDYDGDGRNEVIIEGYGNMNGNRTNTFYYASADSLSLHYAGSFFGEINENFIDKKNRTFESRLEGSWYTPREFTHYEWRNEKLIPVNSLIMRLKKPDFKHYKHWLEYYENPTYDKDTLMLKYKKTFRGTEKQFRFLKKFNIDEGSFE